MPQAWPASLERTFYSSKERGRKNSIQQPQESSVYSLEQAATTLPHKTVEPENFTVQQQEANIVIHLLLLLLLQLVLRLLPSSVQILLLVRLDDQIGSWIRGAREHKAGTNLIVIQEGAIGLVDRAGLDYPGAWGASPSTTRIRQVESRLFSSVQEVSISVDFHFLLTGRGDKLDFVGCDPPHTPPTTQPERFVHRHFGAPQRAATATAVLPQRRRTRNGHGRHHHHVYCECTCHDDDRANPQITNGEEQRQQTRTARTRTTKAMQLAREEQQQQQEGRGEEESNATVLKSSPRIAIVRSFSPSSIADKTLSSASWHILLHSLVGLWTPRIVVR
jgi:hypothetical protein